MPVHAEYIRVVHPRDYDVEQGRFKSLSFKPSSSDGGISVFKIQCGIDASGSVCEHIRKFYDSLTGDPPIYWEIPAEDIPTECEYPQSDSESGDKCHHNIKNWSEKESKKYIKKKSLDTYLICDPNGTRSLTKEDLDVSLKSA